jgi:hypothetical protein
VEKIEYLQKTLKTEGFMAPKVTDLPSKYFRIYLLLKTVDLQGYPLSPS